MDVCCPTPHTPYLLASSLGMYNTLVGPDRARDNAKKRASCVADCCYFTACFFTRGGSLTDCHWSVFILMASVSRVMPALFTTTCVAVQDTPVSGHEPRVKRAKHRTNERTKQHVCAYIHRTGAGFCPDNVLIPTSFDFVLVAADPTKITFLFPPLVNLVELEIFEANFSTFARLQTRPRKRPMVVPSHPFM